MSIVIAFIIVGVLGLLLGLGLAIADKKLAIEKDEKLVALEEAMPEKIEMYYGQYNDNNGGNSYVTVTLPFTPKAVLVFPNGDGNARMITPTQNAVSDTGYICGTLDGNKLQVRLDLTPDCTQPHHFLALK